MAVHLLNNSYVKEGIKNILGCVTFAAGIAVLYQASLASKLQKAGDDSSWQATTDKTVIFFLKTSIVLSCIVSRPGLYLCDWFFHKIATPRTWMDIFGINTIFEFNPWHPRHILNITANAISAAALIKWVFDRYVPAHQAAGLMVALGAFNFMTGRSTLHLVNSAFYSACSARRV
jgi:hypothetical protein